MSFINQQVITIVAQITEYLSSHNQEIIFSGADGVICKGCNLEDIAVLTKIREISKEITFSIGSGNSLRDSYIALRYAKSINKNVAVRFENLEFFISGK